MTIVDSSVLIALAIENDTQHEKALRVIPQTVGPILIPNAVLLETTWALWDMFKDADFVGRWCSEVSRRFQIVCESPELVRKSIERYTRNADRFSLVDCQLIEWAKTEGADVLTFDQAMADEIATP